MTPEIKKALISNVKLTARDLFVISMIVGAVMLFQYFGYVEGKSTCQTSSVIEGTK